MSPYLSLLSLLLLLRSFIRRNIYTSIALTFRELTFSRFTSVNVKRPYKATITVSFWPMQDLSTKVHLQENICNQFWSHYGRMQMIKYRVPITNEFNQYMSWRLWEMIMDFAVQYTAPILSVLSLYFLPNMKSNN